MEKRILGKTGLEVSRLAYGGMELGPVSEATATKLLNAALDQGINYIDTSPEYANSEYFIGKAISHRRDEFVLATKCCDNMRGIGPMYTFDRQTVLENIDESLRLMKTDHIDILQIHGVLPEFLAGGENGEVLETMRELKKAGKVLHLGLTIRNSNPLDYAYPATHGYRNVQTFASWRDIEVIQIVYGCMTRLSENVIQKAYDDYGTGIVARGLLKRYFANYDVRWEDAGLSELLEEGETRNDFLIRYVLTHPAVTAGVCGTRNTEHLAQNIRAASRGPLSPEVYAEAKRRLNYVGIIAGDTEMQHTPKEPTPFAIT
ncbi:MAG: aldo/keto reductase [Ruminococcaceae bacterium]|nr:aldo/keto reductase [Oscillospiraceae bacterium]